uniref:MPK10 n=1 Tax=Arundo donax TaxID=35708 RepID=A0A0A9AJN6_ARUDO
MPRQQRLCRLEILCRCQYLILFYLMGYSLGQPKHETGAPSCSQQHQAWLCCLCKHRPENAVYNPPWPVCPHLQAFDDNHMLVGFVDGEDTLNLSLNHQLFLVPLLAALVELEKPWDHVQKIVFAPKDFCMNYQRLPYPLMRQRDAGPWQELDLSEQ